MVTAACRGWIVVQTKAQREVYAAENIARQGFELYLPRIVVIRPLLGAHAEPFFRSYLFVKTADRWLPLLSTYGVLRVIMSGAAPALVSQQEIDKLKAREDADGFLRLEKPPPQHFGSGDKVRITKGLYAGRDAVYDGVGPQRRVQLLLDYLGRKSKVLISEDCLEAKPDLS
jgi:transcriptional antiterminator RfaH